jgi:opacity protein-like surface antigen
VQYVKKILLLLLLLLPVAPAQLFQNSDIYYVAGPAFAGTQTIGDSGVTLYGATGYAWIWGFGHQFKRIGGASLWLDIPLVFISGSHQTASIPGSIKATSTMLVPGVRLMLPLNSRISPFVSAGGGGGFFTYPVVHPTSLNLVTTNAIDHGVLSFGGGADFRLSQHFSIRVDFRDYVTGRNLAGAPGRNHPLPMIGLAFH